MIILCGYLNLWWIYHPTQPFFEVTESSREIQIESLPGLLDELRKRKNSVDNRDAETGCREMLYLSQVGSVTIGRSLACNAENSERRQTVIQSLMALRHARKKIYVAKDDATESQVALMKKLACDRLQGRFSGKPMPENKFFEKLRFENSKEYTHV